MHRRTFCHVVAATPWALATPAQCRTPFRLRYVLSSAMYGTAPLKEILPEVVKTGAQQIDLWPKPHGNQREQVDQMGVVEFAEMLKTNKVELGVISCYRHGPFRLNVEMDLVKKLGAGPVDLICTGSGPKNAKGENLKTAVKAFVEKMKQHAARAMEHGCRISIENHSNNLIHSADSLKWFGEYSQPVKGLGLAYAPHHLPQDGAMQGRLVRDLGPTIQFFYAQQHGKGSRKKMKKADELLQMPGRGPLDFAPIVAGLKTIGFKGLTEIFMHPFPRGLPILPSTAEITAEINRSRHYLEKALDKS